MIRKDIRMCLQEIDSMRKKNNKTITAIGMAALLTAAVPDHCCRKQHGAGRSRTAGTRNSRKPGGERAGTDLGQHYECEWKQH